MLPRRIMRWPTWIQRWTTGRSRRVEAVAPCSELWCSPSTPAAKTNNGNEGRPAVLPFTFITFGEVFKNRVVTTSALWSAFLRCLSALHRSLSSSRERSRAATSACKSGLGEKTVQSMSIHALRSKVSSTGFYAKISRPLLNAQLFF